MIEVLVFIFLAISWFFLPAIQSYEPPGVKPANDEMPIDNADDQVDYHTPSIFIDKHLLSPIEISYAVDDAVQNKREFLIDGILFRETLEIEKLRHFEVYSNIKMDVSADNSGLSADEDTPLQLYTQNAPNGVIINSNVYLTHQQWHTLVVVSDSTLSCAVCGGVYCDETEHTKLESHKANLDKCRPLDKYDLSITRKIDSYYHCAVCNLLFHKSQNDQHFSGKEHENKLLFAINKVSDIMYDYNVHAENNNVEIKKDTYHYNAKAINNNADDVSSDSDGDYHDSHYNVYGIDYGDHGDEEDDEDFYANVEPPLNLEHSYASMARKPKTDDLPAVLEIDLGNKMVTVKFDSWHMVISPKANMFYCMVCTQYDHIRKKAKHCNSEEHLEKLEQCKVIEMYGRYLVRQVDEKLYHCGHCNNLQLIHEMEDHIQAQHPAAKTTNFDSPKKTPSTPLKNHNKEFKAPNPHTVRNINASFKGNNENLPVTNSNNDNGAVRNAREQVRHSYADRGNGLHNNQGSNGNVDQMTRCVQPQIGFSGKLAMYHALRSANSDINDDIVICVYGCTVRISKLAFNIVCGQADDFYCGLCEVSINKEHLKAHVNDLQHLILLQGSPFIEAFNIHLYRQIRDALHCALCNELIQLIPEMIIRHKMEPKHILCLGKALCYIKNDSPPNVVKNAENSANTANGTTNTPTSNVKVDPKIVTIVNTPVAKAVDENLAPLQTDQKIALVPAKVETKEFIEVKNGLKDDMEDEDFQDLDDSTAEDTHFDLEEYLYVKLGNSYIKITNTSYHTLVDVGDGTKYCFVCSVVVQDEWKKHVDSRGHMENMEKYKFIDKYKEELFRQIYLMYHCGICNVLVTRKRVNHHLSWPTHALQTENTKINSDQRKYEIKAGTKQVTANTQKENIYLNETETRLKIILNIAIQKENVVSVARKNKIVIFNDNVLKISFDSWHSLSALANGWKCKVCQCEFDGKEYATHVSSDWHKVNLDNIEKQHSPALIRKVNDTTLNCIMCNTEVANKRHIIQEHVQGKRHLKNYDNILNESSLANSYADCDDDVLTL